MNCEKKFYLQGRVIKNEEISINYSLPNIIRLITLRKTNCMRHLASEEEIINKHGREETFQKGYS